MAAPFTLPSYKFGNHKPNCDCPTCSRIITSLRKRSYVQKLESLASQLHGEWQQAMGAGLSITQDLNALKTERDGYAAELKTITTEANIQRLAADEAKAGLKILTDKLELLQNDLNVVKAANQTLRDANKDLALEGRRNARLVPVLGSIVLLGGLIGLALWIQSMGGSR